MTRESPEFVAAVLAKYPDARVVHIGPKKISYAIMIDKTHQRVIASYDVVKNTYSIKDPK